jgi:uncharacterized protein YjbJ (UPF0337 family)
MDWNRFEGNWKQFKGRAKEKWGRLTDDDLDVINGRQEQLEGKIQERYGLARDQAKRMSRLGSRHCHKRGEGGFHPLVLRPALTPANRMVLLVS